MARLPIVGADAGDWGAILNEFLTVEHNPDGTQKPLIQSLIVDLEDDLEASEKTANKGLPGGYAPLDDNALVPLSNLPSVTPTPDATTTSLGVVQLSGDLSGTATSPSVPGLTSKVNISTTVNGYPLSANITLGQNDVGLGNVNNTSDATKNSAVVTLTNKRITKRIGTITSSATPTPDSDNNDQYNVTALAVSATFAAPIGTPTDGQVMTIRIKDNGTTQSLAWNPIYRVVGTTLPTTTVASKTLYVGMIYNAADNVWDVIAMAQQ